MNYPEVGTGLCGAKVILSPPRKCARVWRSIRQVAITWKQVYGAILGEVSSVGWFAARSCANWGAGIMNEEEPQSRQTWTLGNTKTPLCPRSWGGPGNGDSSRRWDTLRRLDV